MEIRTIREWLLWKKGEVSTAINKTATIGELIELAQVIEKQLETKDPL